MKKLIAPRRSSRLAFTLVEMLIVIAIMAILASLLFPVAATVTKKRKIKLAETELKEVEAAIQNYKDKLGFYPPDNTNNFVTNGLYFELMGTVLTNDPSIGGDVYITRDGSAWISTNLVRSLFGVDGFLNSSKDLKSSDEGHASQTFFPQLRPNQSGRLIVSTQPLNRILVLLCSVPWSDDEANQWFPPPATVPVSEAQLALNPWHYNSSNPTHNPNSFDLWVDIILGGKTNRISNWSKLPQTL